MSAPAARRLSRLGLVVLASLLAACVYPRRGTSLTPVARPTGSLDAPPDIWSVTIVSAQVSHQMRGAIPWDDGGGLPDVFVRFFRDGELLFETETVDDSLEPVWEARLPRNVHLPSHAQLRFEVWDRDAINGDPVGILREEGLPANAVPGVDARLMLDRGSSLTLRVEPPRPHRGVGIREYEVHDDALVVVSLLPHSPAARAGIEPGDAIVTIGERRVELLNESQGASALSLAQTRGEPLTVRRGGDERVVDLDRGYVWLTM
ncbi:MAG: PDZ domain-containing protein [Sandaracinaceae bacterium]